MVYQLSPHFTVEEMIKSDTAEAMGIINAPNFDVLVQMVLLANDTLEGIRQLCGGHPVLISSGFRCGDLNEAVGGAENSAHLLGCAADFSVPAFGSITDIIAAIEPHLQTLQIDQLINEYGNWVHVGRASFGQTPRYQSFAVT